MRHKKRKKAPVTTCLQAFCLHNCPLRFVGLRQAQQENMAKRARDFIENPLEKANIFSVISFWWLNDIFKRGQKHDLNEEDQYRLLEDDTSHAVCTRLERNWEKEINVHKVTGRKPSLFRAIVKTFYIRWLLLGIPTFLEQALFIAQPVLLANLLRYFENRTTLQNAYLYAAGIFAIALSVNVIVPPSYYQLQRIGWHIRVGTCALMYKKTLKLSQRALANSTTGQIVNLGATDVLRFDTLATYLHFLWITPVECAVVTYLLWRDVGPTSLLGLGVMVVVLFIQGSLGKGFGKIREKMAVLTDERIRTMNEVITAMRIIKMYTWEKPFENLVLRLRRMEIGKVLIASIMKACIYALLWVSLRLFSFVTFSLYVTLGGQLTPSKVFGAMALFSAIRLSLGIFFPAAIESLSESLISLNRIQDFLLLDEFEVSKKSSNEDNLSPCVRFKNFSAKWLEGQEDDTRNNSTSASNENTLSNISVQIESAKLFAVIGPVGCGKSSFLSAILRELPPTNGEVQVVGRVAYVGQVPWIFSGTIRENILFGETYDEIRYKKVIECCALQLDIDSLEKGDLTLVGERGVKLSGGQKARINLARAAYRENTDIILMDDPLSAVDSKVANQLFHQCICKYMKDKIKILVTHQVQFLTTADEIIILKRGEIVGRGVFSELQDSGTDFATLLKNNDQEKQKNSQNQRNLRSLSRTPSSPFFPLPDGFFGQQDDNDVQGPNAANDVHDISFSRSVKRRSRNKFKSSKKAKGQQSLTKDKAEFVASVEEEETRVQGSIGWKVYAEYFNTNKPLLILIALLILASNSVFIICDWWLSVWATQSATFYTKKLSPTGNSSLSTTTSASFTSAQIATFTNAITSNQSFNSTTVVSVYELKFDDLFYVRIFAVLNLVSIVLLFAVSILVFYYLVATGKEMHNKMFRTILHAPVRFFDINPVGRILNRFSKDMGQIDEILPFTLVDFLSVFFTVIAVIFLVVAVNYFVLIVTIPLFIYFIWLRRFYIRTSRDIKRMEGVNRSPVFSHLSTTIQGLTTIRAFRMQNEFATEFHELQDLHSCSWFLFLTCSRWLSLRLDLISAIFVGAAAFSSVLSATFLSNDAGNIGLILTYTIALSVTFQWCVRQSAEVENLMTSVERVQEYYKIPPEAPHELPDNKPPSDWPKQGKITFKNLSFSYCKDSPDVLRNIHFDIHPNEKVGVVGRTGAGKSSLISALFRLNEFTSGEIYIDGLAASSLGLADLRSVISVIPQDPVLFSGSLRKNLDPFSAYLDEELWSALEQVQLKPLVEGFSSKLEHEVSEAGGNFSVGQRQLVCLARAILRKSKILIVDEATANVDLRTDQLIQLTLRSTFKQSTVITVAHRINTVIDSNRVLVLDAGEVVEFDEPHLLLTKQDGVFSQMLESVGKAEANEMRKTAKKVYDDAHNIGSSDDGNCAITNNST